MFTAVGRRVILGAVFALSSSLAVALFEKLMKVPQLAQRA